jgi:hypothetical protein
MGALRRFPVSAGQCEQDVLSPCLRPDMRPDRPPPMGGRSCLTPPLDGGAVPSPGVAHASFPRSRSPWCLAKPFGSPARLPARRTNAMPIAAAPPISAATQCALYGSVSLTPDCRSGAERQHSRRRNGPHCLPEGSGAGICRSPRRLACISLRCEHRLFRFCHSDIAARYIQTVVSDFDCAGGGGEPAALFR